MIPRAPMVLSMVLLALAFPASAQQDTVNRTTFGGLVVDAINGDPLPNAIVILVDENRGMLADSIGRFSFADVPIGPQLVAVKQYGYDEVDVDLEIVAGQGPYRIELRPGPIALEGFTVVADNLATMSRRLANRRNAYGGSVRTLDQARLAGSGAWSGTELLEREAGLDLVPCDLRAMSTVCVWRRGGVTEPSVFIDEARVIGGLEFLAMYRPFELYLVEVYSAGRMIRAYTHWYMERMAGSPQPLL